ncbi:MAG: pyridoxine 5'-phosphate oxidase C-terminal domain-containing protein, partial [Parvularculaceae bacterium]
DPQALKEAFAKYEREFAGREVPRPGYWRGYILEPREIEFWVNRPFRLHDRLLFARATPGAPWTTRRLFP